MQTILHNLCISLIDCSLENIFVETATGKAIPLKVKHSDTIENVKLKVQDKEGFPSKQQQLMFAEQRLNDEQALWEYKIQENSIIYLLIGMARQHSVHILYT